MKRRELLAAALAGACAPALACAQGNDDAGLRAALDGLAALDSPSEKLERLAGFDSARLSPAARIDLETVRIGLDVDKRLAARFPIGRFGRSPYTLSPNAGAWREAGHARDEATLARRIDAETEQVRAEAGRGVILPRSLLARTAAGIAKARADAPAGIAPALARQADLLASLDPRAPAEPGVSRFPGGADYFALLLERNFGAIDPAEAHRRFVDKAREITAHADAVLRRLGLTRGAVGARISAAFRDARFLYPDSDVGRDRAVAEMNAWLDRARARVPALIGPVPPMCLDVSVRRMSAKEEAEGRQGYRTIAAPGASGVYWVDLKRIRNRPSWTLGAVVHHELLPGHMIQLPIEDMAKPHPLRIEYTGPFAEGWAIYAEELMAREGAFAGNDRALLGHLHWMLFRIGRALVDTGVHLGHYSSAQTSEKLASLQGEPAYFAPFAQDIERITIEPSIRAAEALTWLTLAERGRTAARAGMGLLRTFHQKVIADGRKRLETIT